jgi:hypothetical protein
VTLSAVTDDEYDKLIEAAGPTGEASVKPGEHTGASGAKSLHDEREITIDVYGECSSRTWA